MVRTGFLRLVLLALVCLGALKTAQAQDADEAAAALAAVRNELGLGKVDDSVAALVPDKYIVSRDPPGMRSGPAIATEDEATARRNIEKPQAVSGTLYTVIAPIYLGGGPDGGNTSYVRFINDESYTTTFAVNVVGYRTDSTTNSQSQIIGTALVTVPQRASPQYSVADIFAAANIPSVACPTTCPPNVYQGVALYVSNIDDDVGYQHVIHNVNSRFFENVTLCGDDSMSDGINQRYRGLLTNVHSYNYYMTEYPASLMMHNYAPVNQTYEIYVIDSRTGAVQTLWRATLLANTTYVIPIRQIQQETGWNPTDLQSHINLQIFRPVGSSVGLTNTVMGQLIYNQALQAYVNMSQVCEVY